MKNLQIYNIFAVDSECVLPISRVTVSYAYYENEKNTKQNLRQCQNICWNTLFMVAEYDQHLEGATNSATFFIERGVIKLNGTIDHNTKFFASNRTLRRQNPSIRWSDYCVAPLGVMCSLFSD